MVQVRGTSILPDIAIGKIKFYPEPPQPEAVSARTPEEERDRVSRACAQAAEQLEGLRRRALAEAGEEEAAILEIHRMLLEDEDFRDAVEEGISAGASAEYAVNQAGERIARLFARMDEYMQARAADILDIASRLVRVLSGAGELELSEPSILMARDLAPSTTIQLDRSRLLGFVTQEGSPNSHTAILSRTLNIPALVQTRICPEWDGQLAVLDGVHGVLCIQPDEGTLEELAKTRAELARRREELLELRGKRAVSRDGREILTFANVGSLHEIQLAMEQDAQGVGLFRSEFLFLNRSACPTEEEQYRVYRKALERMEGRKVVVRTVDIGADKRAGCVPLEPEENPALGLRGIRVCLERPALFRTQLRALLQAAVHGELAVMYPMIASLEEVLEVKALVRQVYQELCEAGVPCRMPEQGIMIETPAAAVICDILAPQVDFFSIGTNDLTQYTLAADRQNARLARYSDPRHPAILRLIRHVAEVGHRAGLWVGICGELAADPRMTGEFLAMGIDELSVAPGQILELRARVRELDGFS